MLKRKMFRDLLKNKSQFITIFVMLMLSAMAFTGVHAYMDGMQYTANKYYASQNLADIWATKNNFSEDDLEKIKKIDNVKNVERYTEIRSNLEGYDDTIINIDFIESNDINKLYVVEGESFDASKDGIWLDQYLAKNLNIKVGDEINLKYEKYSIKGKILGLVLSPSKVYDIKDDTALFPTHKDSGYAYMSFNRFPLEYKIYTNVIVDIDDTSKLDETKSKISEIEGVSSVTQREDQLSYSNYQEEIDEGKTYSFVFTAIFIVIGVLSVITTMNRFVKRERTQIGTLKALGVKTSKIVFHYISYILFISIFAVIVGMILGETIIGRTFLNMEFEYYEMPNPKTEILPICYEVSAGIVVVITIITYFSIRKILKEPAAKALRLEVPNVKISNSNITTKGIFKKMSLSTRWNLRDIGRSKGRTIAALVGIMGCTMLVLVALGMKDTMNKFQDWDFDIIYNFEYKMSLSDSCTQEQIDNIKEKYGNNSSETLGIEVKLPDGKTETNTLTINHAEGYLQVTDHNLNPMKLPGNGIIVTEKLSSTKGYKIGDKIKWHVYGEDNWYETEIVGFNRDPQSQSLTVSKEFYENVLHREYKPDSFYTNADLTNKDESTKDKDKFIQIEGVSTIQSVQNLKESVKQMMSTMDTFVSMLITISVILGFVIIYNLGTLSYSEKQYQFATLKVLGFKLKQIRRIFIQQNVWISVIGIILSMPMGYGLCYYIFTKSLSDGYDMPVMIKMQTYIITAIASFIVSLIINIIVSKKLKKIDMVSCMKANE